ncbi:MAG: TorF family putative porin, partial [Alphaproteobacteria bacterium]|nr:TorF family putative porin [Alphaproteobacteria bacterium]
HAPFVCFCAFFCAQTACAQRASLDINATLTSDYRFRGISQSNGDPAMQVSAEVSLPMGAYAGVWTSSVSGGLTGGAKAEADFYAGYRKHMGLFAIDMGSQYNSYPGAASDQSPKRIKAYVSASATVAFTTLRIGANLTPEQSAVVRGKTYVYGDVIQPIPRFPITLRGHFGHTWANTGVAPNYSDYLAGVDYTRKKWTLEAAYVGTDMSRAMAGALYTLVRPKVQLSLSYQLK